LTLEALIYGLMNGLVLGNIFTAFMVLNLVLPTHSLVRLIPRAYYSLAIVISIAITFLPVTRRQLQLVIEAQAIRGKGMRGVGDYLALIMPVLENGLERSVQLAETLTARGFASAETENQSSRYQWGTLAGLVLILAGWILNLDPEWRDTGILLVPTGCLLVGGMLWAGGRGSRRTSYRKETWRWLDGLAIACAAGNMLIVMELIPGLDTASLHFTPYPSLSIPRFDPWIGMVVICLVYPIIGRIGKTK
jgi:energy-coupling factor transport system permease protein